MQDSSTIPQPPVPAAPAGQNPLDALEALLKQAQSANGAATAPPTAGADQVAGPTGQTPEQQAVAAQDAQKQQAYEAMDAEHQVVDQQKILENLAEIKKIAETPQEQARAQQEKDKKDDLEKNLQLQADYQINQLGHTKI